MHQSSYHIMKQFRDIVSKHFKSLPVRVLDVGSCGVNGTYKELFSDTKLFTYLGLDVSPGDNVDYVPREPYAWPELENESFDVIISGQAFEHIEFPWLVMEEMSSKLKRDGLICIVAPSRGPEHKHPVDCWRYYADGFRALAKWVGLEVIESKTNWGASGFTDGSDQWGDTFCILHKLKNFHSAVRHGRLQKRTFTSGNQWNPLRTGKKSSYYGFPRHDVVNAVVNSGISAGTVLEIGCAGGMTGKGLKEKMPVHYYVGIELSPEAAEAAKQHLDKVIVADIETTDLRANYDLKPGEFDLLVALDVLEHLYDPWDAIKELTDFIRPGGHVVLSIPNVQNITVLQDLLRGRWQYQDAGLLDATHLRFFTYAEAERMIRGAGLSIKRIERVINPPLDMSKLKDTGNIYRDDNLSISNLSKDEVINFFTYQFIVIAQKEPSMARAHASGDRSSSVASSGDQPVNRQLAGILSRAHELHQAGDTDKAVECLLEGIRQAPDDPESYCLMARILIDTKRHQDALDALRSIAGTARDTVAALLLTGHAREGLGLDAEAEESADAVLSQEPNHAGALNLKGLLARKRNDLPAAEDFFLKAAAADPRSGEAYANLGAMKRAGGDREGGMALLEQGFVLTPQVMNVATTYHAALTEPADLVRGENFFREAHARHPRNQNLAFLLIDLLLKQGRDNAAMSVIEEALATFALTDGLLAAALAVREKVGARDIPEDGRDGATLSLAMIVKNEEAHLAKCLLSVRQVVDELIVVDTGSNDRTTEVAKAMGAKVYEFPWTDDFSAARNHALAKTTGTWVLVLDADEVISSQDHERLSDLIRKSRPAAYVMETRNYVDFHGLHGWTRNDDRYTEQAGVGWISSRKIRLFPRHDAIRFVNPVHEFVEPSVKAIPMDILECDIPVHHYGQLLKADKKEKDELYLRLGRQKIENLGRDNPKALWEMGIQYFVTGKYRDALDMFLEITRLDTRRLNGDPRLSKVHMQTGICFMCLHDYAAALGHLEKALTLEPDLKEALYNYSLTLVMLGNADKALTSAKAFCAFMPNSQQGIYLLALAELCAGHRKEGEAILRTINRSDRLFVEIATLFIRELKLMNRGDYLVNILGPLKENHLMGDELTSLFQNNGDTLMNKQGESPAGAPLPDGSPFNPAAAATSALGSPVANFEHTDPHKGMTSIIILTFNQLNYTRECVESIRTYTPEPHEIIFVDNGSTDGTVPWLKKLVGEVPNYRLVENAQNRGFAKGCNQGIQASRGEYLLLLNNDVVVTEQWLSGLIECLKSDPAAGIIGPMTNNISGTQRDLSANYPNIKAMHVYARSFMKDHRHRRISLRRIVGFCMLFGRPLVERIGLLDESFGTGNFEDDDFCLRSSLAGYRNMIAGDVFIHHYGSRSFAGNKIDYQSAMTGNRKVFNEKWSRVQAGSALGKQLMVSSALEQADELNQKGDIDRAIERILEGIGQVPDESSLYVKLAGILFDNKRYQDAVEALATMPPGNEDRSSMLLRGYSYDGLDRLKEADEHADLVLQGDPSNAAALNLKGVIAYKSGDRDAAENWFNKAVAQDPGYGEPFTNLGVMRWATGAREDGLSFLERGFILSPTIMDSATMYHTAVTGMEKFARAEQLFREAAALHPQNQRIAFLLIDLLLRQGKENDAMARIEEAMMRFTVEDGLLAAALAVRKKVGPKKIKKGRTKGTLSLSMIVKNEEQHIANCLMSVRPVVDEMIVVDTGSTDRTADIARALGAKVYEFPWTHDFSAARNYALSLATGQWVLSLDADEVIAARDHAQLSALVQKSNPAAYIITTRNYTAQLGAQGFTLNDGRYPGEERALGWHPSSKVRLFPNNMNIRFEKPVHEFVEDTVRKANIPFIQLDIPVHHYGRLDRSKVTAKGEAYYLLGKKKLASQGFIDEKALFELGVQAAELKKFGEAAELYKKLLALNPAYPHLLFNLGFVYLELKQYDDALKITRQYYEKDPEHKENAINYAHCELVAGNVSQAIFVLEKTLHQILGYVPARVILAAAYYVNHRKAEALNIIHDISSKGFDCSVCLDDIAGDLQAIGRFRQALDLFEMIVKSGQMTEGTRDRIDACYKASMTTQDQMETGSPSRK